MRWNTRAIWPGELAQPLWRFPLPLLFAVFAAWVNWNLVREHEEPHGGQILLTAFAAGAFMWSWAAALWAQTLARWLDGLLIGVAGALLLALILRVDLAFPLWLSGAPDTGTPPLTTSHPFLLGALMLTPSVAPFLFRDVSQSAFWQYNHKWLVGFAAACVGSVLAGAGVSAVLGTAGIVFDTQVAHWVYGRVWIIAMLLGLPWIWLALSPEDFHEETKTGAAQEFTSRAVGLLVIYILVPVTLALSALLISYIVRVIANGSYLTAKLGMTSIVYGVSVILVGLLAYPQRADNLLLRLFWRIRPFLLIAPAVLLFPALWVRIAEYGWTPDRYLALITGLWVTGVLVIGLLRRRGREEDLRLIPCLLALLLAASAFGPWGVGDVSGRSQYARLAALLTAKGLLADGRWHGTEQPIQWDGTTLTAPSRRNVAAAAVDKTDRALAQSAIETLWVTGQLGRLRPWFEGQPDDPFAAENQPWRVVDAVKRKLGLQYALPPLAAPSPRISFSSGYPLNIALPGEPGTLVGPLSMTSLATQTTFDTASGKASLVMEGRQVHLNMGETRLASFDLSITLADLAAPSGVVVEPPQPNRRPAIVLEGTNPQGARLAITSLSGNFNDTQANLQLSAYVLLLTPH